MNKNILVLVFAGIIFTSCTSISKKDVSEQILNPRLETATKNLAALMCENNLTAAYGRMDSTYKQFYTEQQFIDLWKNATNCSDTCKTEKLFSPENYLNSYTDLIVVYELYDKKIYGKYTFSNNNPVPLPINVTYGDYININQFDKTLPDYEKELKLVKKHADSIYDLTEALCTDSLKELCSDYFKIGCGLNGLTLPRSAISHPQFMEVAGKHFSSVTLTNMMKPYSVLNQTKSIKNYKNGIKAPGMDFSAIDSTLQWCMDNNIQMRGHTLVWHTQTPEWFFHKGYESTGELVSRDEMIERLDSFTQQYFDYVQTNYPGVVYCWDVVNEAVDPSEGDTNSDFRCRIMNSNNKNLWYFTIGADYPEVAFTIARKYAAKGVSLFYNDYGTCDALKRKYIYNLCKDLKDKGLIDGIGMQGYWDFKNPSLNTIKDTINYYAELDLEIQLTEWTVSVKNETPDEFNQQAERYASVLRLLQQLDTQGGGNANITCVSFFGLMDGFPLNQNDTTTSRLFDKNLKPKPAFFSVQDTFKLFY